MSKTSRWLKNFGFWQAKSLLHSLHFSNHPIFVPSLWSWKSPSSTDADSRPQSWEVKDGPAVSGEPDRKGASDTFTAVCKANTCCSVWWPSGPQYSTDIETVKDLHSKHCRCLNADGDLISVCYSLFLITCYSSITPHLGDIKLRLRC